MRSSNALLSHCCGPEGRKTDAPVQVRIQNTPNTAPVSKTPPPGNEHPGGFVHRVNGGDQSQKRNAGHLIGYGNLNPIFEYL